MKPTTKADIEGIYRMRQKARTDLLYLCNHILGYPDVCQRVHFPLLNILTKFIPQGKDEFSNGWFHYTPPNLDPTKVLEDNCRRRLILDPRSFLKTTINVIAHSIQWVLNYPNVRILIVHASESKAQEILREIKGKFQYNPVLRQIFPEFCPQRRVADWGNQTEMYCPIAEIRKEPTISLGSIEKAMAGSHYHVIKFTDVVDFTNTTTPDQLAKVRRGFAMFQKLLVHPGCWIDVEGTRYDFEDLYGKIIEGEEKEEEKTWKVHIRGVFKKDVEAPKFDLAELEVPDKLDDGKRISWWPERFSLKEMEAEARDPILGGTVFSGQRLNNPLDTAEGRPFPLNRLEWADEEPLNKVVNTIVELTRRGRYDGGQGFLLTTIDTAETVSVESNDTVITTCWWSRTQKCFVIDCRIGRFLPSDAVRNFFEVFIKYRPMKILIEETSFVRGLRPYISKLGDELKTHPDIDKRLTTLPVFDFIKRDTRTSKVERIIENLQPWYKNGDLRFSSGLPNHVKERIKLELSRFPKTGKNDVLDTLADQFQNREWFGKLKERPSVEEIMTKARDRMLGQQELKDALGLALPTEGVGWYDISGGL